MKSSPLKTSTPAPSPRQLGPKPTLKRKLRASGSQNRLSELPQTTHDLPPSQLDDRSAPKKYALNLSRPSALPAIPQPQMPTSIKTEKKPIFVEHTLPSFKERFSANPDNSCFSPNNRYAWCVDLHKETPVVVLIDLHDRHSMILTDRTGNSLAVTSERCSVDPNSYAAGLSKDFYGRLFTNDSRHFCMYSRNRLLVWKLSDVTAILPLDDPNEQSETKSLKASNELHLVPDTATYEEYSSCAWMQTDSFLIGHRPRDLVFVALNGEDKMIQHAPSRDSFPEAPHSQTTHGDVLSYMKTHEDTVQFYQIKNSKMVIFNLPNFDASKTRGEFSIVNNGEDILLVSEEYQLYAWHYNGETLDSVPPPQFESAIRKVIHHPNSPYVGITSDTVVKFFTYHNRQWQIIGQPISPKALGHRQLPVPSHAGSFPHSTGQNPHVFRLLTRKPESVPFWVNYDDKGKRAVPLSSMLGDNGLPINRCAFSVGDMQVAVAEDDAVVLWDLRGDTPKRDKILPGVPKLAHFDSYNLASEANTLLAWALGHVALLKENATQWTVLKLPSSLKSYMPPALSKDNDLITFTTTDDRCYVMRTQVPNEPDLSPLAVSLTSHGKITEKPISSRFTPDGCFALVRVAPPRTRSKDTVATETNLARFAREHISGRLFDLKSMCLMDL